MRKIGIMIAWVGALGGIATFVLPSLSRADETTLTLLRAGSDTRSQSQGAGSTGSTAGNQVHSRTSADSRAAVNALRQLGWKVQSGTGQALEFSDIYSNVSMRKSANYFLSVNKPFAVTIVGAKSLDGIRGLAGAKLLTSLSLDAPGLSDISELAYLHNLTRLVISGSTTISDLSALKGLSNLKELYLDSTAILDLSQIKSLGNITTLTIRGAQINDLSRIRDFQNLQSLDVSGTSVEDFSALTNIDTLRSLDVNGHQVAGLPVLRHMSSLKTLRVSTSNPFDLSPIGDLGALETLSIEGPLKLNLAPLRKLTRLSSFSLSGQGAHVIAPMQLEDLDAIGELHALKTLSFLQAQITDLSFMRGLPNLTALTIIDSRMSDITGIGQAKALTTIHFEDVRVSEISPLLDLPNLRELFLQRTPASPDVLTSLEQHGVKIYK